MFTVLNSYRDENNVLLYAVKDFADSTGDVEIITEEELKLLVSCSMPLQDMTGERVTLNVDDTLVCNVEDITDQLNESIQQDEDEDGYIDIYAEDSDDSDEDSGGEDGIDSDDEDIIDLYADKEEGGTAEDDSTVEDDSFGDEFDIYGFYDDEDENDVEGSIVSKLYALLTEEQITILRRYYLWFSQRLFTDAQKDPTMGFKNKAKMIQKRDSLNQLRGNGDYRYAGFLDTGSKRSGYTCSLGHPLRYMHLAWDITVGDIETAFFGEDYDVDYEQVIASNNCIIFGIKCIGDFFEVNSDCIKALQRAQRDSLKDMALLYDIYESNQVAEANSSFKLLDEIMKRTDKISLMSKDNPIIPNSVAAFYHQFRNAGLVPPKSLVQEIRSCMLKWTDGKGYFSNKWVGELKFPSPKFNDSLASILGKKYADFCSELKWWKIQHSHYYDLIEYIESLIYIMFAFETCGIYKYNADTNKDEGGKSKPVRQHYATLYGHNTEGYFSDFEYSLAYLKKLIDLNNVLEALSRNNRTTIYKINIYSGSGYDDSIKEYDLFDSYDYKVKDATALYDTEKGTKLVEMIDAVKTLPLFFRRPYSFKRLNWFTLDADDKYSLDNCLSVISAKVSEFNSMFNDFKNWLDIRNQKGIEEYIAKIQREKEAEEERLRAEEKLRLEKELAEKEEKLRKEQEMLSEDKASDNESPSKSETYDTPKAVVQYLLGQDLSAYKTSHEFALKVLDTLAKSKAEPSSRQFYYLQPLFEEVSGQKYSGVAQVAQKVNLTDKPDIAEAVHWVNTNSDEAIKIANSLQVKNVGKTLQILVSIERYKTISERQMKYAEIALELYKNRG